MSDRIRIEILEDGTLSIDTDAISGPNHKSADELLDSLEEIMGGRRIVAAKPGHEHHAKLHGGHKHKHGQGHQHQH